MMDLEMELTQDDPERKIGENIGHNLAGFSLEDNPDMANFMENQQSSSEHKSDKFNKQFKMAGRKFLKDALMEDGESLEDERL